MSTTKVITGKCRASYANVFKPKAIQEGSDPKYSIALLIPKTDKATLKKVNDAIEAAKELGKSKWGGKIPAKLKTPLRDGDEEVDKGEAYEGHFFLNANSNRAPQIIDKDKNEILVEDEFYSGCFCRASLNFYPFDTNGNRGVAVGLGNLQKLAEGPRLDGSTSAEEDFSDDFDDPDAELM